MQNQIKYKQETKLEKAYYKKLTITVALVLILVVSVTEVQDVAVPRGREADLVVGESGSPRAPRASVPDTAPIDPRDAESLDASTTNIPLTNHNFKST